MEPLHAQTTPCTPHRSSALLKGTKASSCEMRQGTACSIVLPPSSFHWQKMKKTINKCVALSASNNRLLLGDSPLPELLLSHKKTERKQKLNNKRDRLPLDLGFFSRVFRWDYCAKPCFFCFVFFQKMPHTGGRAFPLRRLCLLSAPFQSPESHCCVSRLPGPRARAGCCGPASSRPLCPWERPTDAEVKGQAVDPVVSTPPRPAPPRSGATRVPSDPSRHLTDKLLQQLI